MRRFIILLGFLTVSFFSANVAFGREGKIWFAYFQDVVCEKYVNVDHGVQTLQNTSKCQIDFRYPNDPELAGDIFMPDESETLIIQNDPRLTVEFKDIKNMDITYYSVNCEPSVSTKGNCSRVFAYL